MGQCCIGKSSGKTARNMKWCTKYRKLILTGDIEASFKCLAEEVVKELPSKIIEMETMPDHVHMLVDCSTQFFIPDAIKRLKGQTAKKLLELYPELRRTLRGGSLWNPSCCAVSVSDRFIARVQQYIREQKGEPDHD